MENSTVINLCGNYPGNFEKLMYYQIQIMFLKMTLATKQYSYMTMNLTVFVNSFVECEHYVLGGWDNSPTQFNEISYHNLLYNVIGALVVRFLLKKYFLINMQILKLIKHQYIKYLFLILIIILPWTFYNADNNKC